MFVWVSVAFRVSGVARIFYISAFVVCSSASGFRGGVRRFLFREGRSKREVEFSDVVVISLVVRFCRYCWRVRVVMAWNWFVWFVVCSLLSVLVSSKVLKSALVWKGFSLGGRVGLKVGVFWVRFTVILRGGRR